jgi:hypothetical protein
MKRKTDEIVIDQAVVREVALSVVASGGGLAAAVAGGAASGGLGALATRFLGRERAELIETMISEGGLVLFVRVRSEAAERRAEQIMCDQGVEAVRVHEIALADVICRLLVTSDVPPRPVRAVELCSWRAMPK